MMLICQEKSDIASREMDHQTITFLDDKALTARRHELQLMITVAGALSCL